MKQISRRTFLGATLTLPLLKSAALAQLPLRTPGLEHIGLTVPDPEAAAKFYGRIFNPQLFKEREPPPRFYVTTGTAYLAFGGSTTVPPRIDHICALVHDYRAQDMRKLLEEQGMPMGGVGMIGDPDGLRLQLLNVPGGLAGTIVPGGRISLEEPVAQAIGLDHIMLRVSDLERSTAFYRKFFGMESSRTKNPERVWFQVAKTRIGLERGQPAVDHFCLNVAGFNQRTVTDKFKELGVEVVPSNDEKLFRFRDPNGIVVELKG